VLANEDAGSKREKPKFLNAPVLDEAAFEELPS
jgi:NAD-dependent DNA ligase